VAEQGSNGHRSFLQPSLGLSGSHSASALSCGEQGALIASAGDSELV